MRPRTTSPEARFGSPPRVAGGRCPRRARRRQFFGHVGVNTLKMCVVPALLPPRRHECVDQHTQQKVPQKLRPETKSTPQNISPAGRSAA